MAKLRLCVCVSLFLSLLAAKTTAAPEVSSATETNSTPTYTLPAGFSPVGAEKDTASGLPLRIRHTATGYELVLIPAGEFQMGSADGTGNPNERPRHRVWLDAYYLGVTEVSNAHFRKFNARFSSPPYTGEVPLDRDDQPAVCVSWREADAWCKAFGMSLPTEAQWERAARGTDGRDFPWGSDVPPDGAGNFADAVAMRANSAAPGFGFASNARGYEDGYPVSSPVGTFGKTEPFGLRDMAGNVREWCADWFAADYYRSSPRENPTGPESGEMKVVRGASWWNQINAQKLGCAYRGFQRPQQPEPTIGFRAALNLRAN